MVPLSRYVCTNPIYIDVKEFVLHVNEACPEFYTNEECFYVEGRAFRDFERGYLAEPVPLKEETS